MARVSVSAVVASTHSTAKYPGWTMAPEALDQMAAELKGGKVPLLFGHDITQPLNGHVTDARVIDSQDGHRAVEVDLDVDEAEWRAVEQQFAQANAPGGMSFRATALETPPSSGDRAILTVAIDAGAWSDDDRAAVVATLDAVVPTEGAALFEFSVVEVVAAVFVLQDVAVGVVASAIYDAIQRLFRTRKRGTRTRIELKTVRAGGEESTAIVETDDVRVALAAVEKLSNATPAGIAVYDQETERWIGR